MYAVLCIDDNAANLNALSFIVRSRGYICITAPNAEEAIAAFNGSKADLVVLDQDLTSMPAYKLATHMKQSRNVPIVLLSHNAFLEKPSFIDIVVKKPVESRDFGRIITWVIQQSRSPSVA